MMEPAHYVRPDVSEARVARLWGNVSERLARRRPLRRAVRGGAAVAALSAAVALWFVFDARVPSTVPSAFEQATFETRSDGSQVALGDGSSIELAPQSLLEVRESGPRAVTLALGRGRVTCDVTKDPRRTFSVLAGDVNVRVTGTRFVVSRSSGDDPRVEVSVERGSVEITGPRVKGGAVRLSAGQSFRDDPAPVAAAAPAALPSVRPQELKLPAPAPVAPGARELFDEANGLRRDGQLARAAEAYESLLRRFPADSRAGLAAFELGRLRMDSLGDLPGAAVALEKAVALTRGSGFREDAVARLVRVYDALGRSADCARSKAGYLKSYPNGVHREALLSRCGGS